MRLRAEREPEDGLRRIHEPVADPGLVEDVSGPRRIGLDLSTEVRHVDVEGSSTPPCTRAPRSRAGSSGASSACPRSRQAAAGGRTRSASGRPRRPCIVTTRSRHRPRGPRNFDGPRLDEVSPAAMPRVAAQGVVAAERLGDVIVGASVERGDLLRLLADGGEHQDGSRSSTSEARDRRRCHVRPGGARRG